MKDITKIIRFLFISLFLISPLLFTQSNSELFEVPKMYFVYFLTILITTFHLINFLKKQVPLFKKSFINISLFLFLLSQIISTFYSIDPHTSFFGYYSRLNGGLLSLICYFFLYLILSIYLDSKFKKQLINYFLLSGFLVSIYAIAQRFGVDKNWWDQDVQSRVFSTFGQPNWLAAYLCIIIPFSLYKLLVSSNLFYQYYFLLITLSFYLALLFTKSKSGIIACLFSLIVYFIFRSISDFKNKFLFKNFKFYLIYLIIIISTLLINNPVKDNFFSKKQSSPTINSSSKILVTSSGDIRKIVWTGAIDLWKKFPIFGTGVETFAYSYYWTRPAEHNLTSEWDYLYNKAHNEYINYLATTGSIGFTTYLFLIISVLITLFIKNKSKLFLPLTCSYLTILITNFAGFSVVVTSLFFFLLPSFLNSDQKIFPIKNIKNKSNLIIIPLIIISFLLTRKTILFYLADITYSQAEKFDSKNNYLTALSYIETSYKFNPKEPVYTDKLANIYSKIALSNNKQDDINQAIKYSDLTIKTSPANINFWKQRAQTFLYLSGVDSKYFSESIAALDKASFLAPTDAKIYYSIGQFLEAASLFKEAIPYYQKAIELKTNYDHAYFALGKIYLSQKEKELAKENFQKVIDYSYPTNIEAQNLLKNL